MSERLKLFAFGCVVLGASLVVPLLVLGVHLSDRSAALFTTMYAAAPMAVAIALTMTRFKAPVADVLGLRLRPSPWLFAGWLLPVPIALVAFAIAAMLPEARVADGLPWLWFEAIVPYTAWGALLALPQEAAWRGFVLGALRPSFLRAWLVTASVWAAWQLPLVFLSASRMPWWVGVGSSVGFAIFATPLALLVRLRSGSVIASAVLVGALKATGSAVAQATNVAAPVALVPLAIAAAIVATYETRSPKPTAAPSKRA